MIKLRFLLMVLTILGLNARSQFVYWTTQNTNLAASRGINDLQAVNSNVLWAAAYDGTSPTNACVDVSMTSNGGTLWNPRTIGVMQISIANLSAIDASKCWAACYYPSGSGTKDGIYYTANGGVTWTQQTTAAFANASSFVNLVWFWDANTGYCMGDPINGEWEIYTTVNGGTTWTLVPGNNIPNPISGEFGIVGYQTVVGNTVWFGTNKGRIYKSIDKGLNWTVSTCTPLNNLYVAPFFKDQNYGLVMDKDASTTGFLAKSTDGGTTWSAANNTGNTFTNDMDYVDGTAGTWVSTGADATNGNAGVTYSFDDGITWIDMTETIGSQFLATAWLNESTGWAGSFVDGTTMTGGMYKFNGSLTAPVADFSANNTSIGVGGQVTFTNLSTGNPTSYSWVFQGGTPGTSTLQNPPPITYNAAGSYNVTLTITNQFGTDTELKTGYINVGSSSYVTVTSPNGGENWLVGSVHNITWNSSGINNVKIEYSINNGATWYTVTTAYPANTGTYAWTIPNAPSSQCKVKISSVENASIADMSDNVFTISTVNQSIAVTSPNGGENWLAGSTHNITWTSTGVTTIKIEYSTDNGTTWLTIISAFGASAGTFAWIVPNTPSNQCKIKISDTGTPSIYDMSDNVFVISTNAQSITVYNPNGGENWLVGSVQYITWTSSGVFNVKLEYTTNGGSTWNTIITSYPASTGSYPWVIPNTPSGQCKVRISDSGNAAVLDVSDNPFTISVGGQSTPEICIVSVDSTNNKNMIVWEKPYSTTIDHYNIYAESNQANVYTLIGSVPYSGYSTFTDMTSNPLQQADRYKISIVDISNVETALSDEHMTIHLAINQGVGNTFNLIWNNYEGFAFPSLNIYRGSTPTNMTLLATVASSINSFTDLYPPGGYVYYKMEVVKPVPCSPSKAMISSSFSNISSNDPYLNVKEDAKSEIRVFPNPTSGIVRIVSKDDLQRLEVYNSIGSKVRILQNPEKEVDLDLTEFGKGVYFIQVAVENKMETKKVVVF